MAEVSTVDRRRLSGLARWDVVVALLLVAVLAYGFAAVDNFGSTVNLSFLIGNTMAIALVALPMTMLVVAGEVDLSVGSTAGLASALMGALWNANWPIEYIIPWSAWVSAAPPQLYGRSFTSVTSLHLWALHAWIWRPNPDGMFANYNPNVKLCPGH